jgi:hypothetical protein
VDIPSSGSMPLVTNGKTQGSSSRTENLQMNLSIKDKRDWRCFVDHNHSKPNSRQLEKAHSFGEQDSGNIAVVASARSDLTILTMRHFTPGLDNGEDV